MIELTGDRVLIRRLKTPRQRGAILAPDAAVKLSQEGIVEGVGPGDRDKKGRRQPLDVEIGQRILFGVHSASPVDVDGNERWILREKDIIAVIE